MNNKEPFEESELDLFLDKLLDQQGQEKFLNSTPDKEFVEEQMELQDKIDSSLRNSFALSATESLSLIASLKNILDSDGSAEQQEKHDLAATEAPKTRQTHASDLENASVSASRPNRPDLPIVKRPVEAEQGFLLRLTQSRAFKVALAASLLLAIGLSVWNSGGNAVGPHFEPQSLVMLYRENVRHGFRPYYNCEDMDRFADTFETRNGKRLALSEMPAGTKMLGLSYLGGISRDTTAMLGMADSMKVIVFVDKANNREALEAITSKLPQHPELNLFVVEKYGLIFVEVSPLDSSRLIEHMTLADPA